jgi:hypothetical protein
LVDAFAPAYDFALGEFVACNAMPEVLLPVLTGLAARGVDDNRQLVEQAFAKTIGNRSTASPATINRLATAIGGLKAAYFNAYHATAAAESRPLVDELLARGQPLVEQWESHGRGLVLQIARSTEETVVPSAAEITLVYPLVGGHGLAHRTLNAVTFEAVLTDPCVELPEVLRLTWLLAQLNLDLPMYADHVASEHRDLVGQWATIPPVLAAAETAKLLSLSTDTLQQALVAWRVVDPHPADDAIANQAATLMNWWRTLDEGQTAWPVALAALEQMLFSRPDRA